MGTHTIFESDFDCLTKMRSRSSSSTENSIHSAISSSVITNEELGISQSEGALGLSRLEELELGVETVKQRILTSTENEEQKSLLIEKSYKHSRLMYFITILRLKVTSPV